jgi:hypothetical protein
MKEKAGVAFMTSIMIQGAAILNNFYMIILPLITILIFNGK